MAIGNISNITAGKPNTSGCIYRAPKGTALPTDATTSLAQAYKKLGYISDDGVKNTNSPSTDKIKGWGGDTVLTIQTEKNDEFKFTLIETLNEEVLKSIFGSSNVTSTTTSGVTNTTVNATSTEQEEAVWVFDLLLRGNALKRIAIPVGKISDIGEIVYKDDEAVGYEITIDAMPNDDGNSHIEFIKTGTANSQLTDNESE